MAQALDLGPYRLPLAPMPVEAQRVFEQGVRREAFPGPEQALDVLVHQRSAYPDGVRRASDGKALVLCTTHLPEVTPAMIDWWFGWHLPETARYQLWHPIAHLKAVVKEDRSQLSDDRARYVGNTSYVDETIGAAMTRLAIEFQDPESFGLRDLDARGATAVCARTVDRVMTSEGGRLVHLILPTPGGAEMRSAFWLGDLQSRLPLIGGLVTRLVNREFVRTRAIPDRFLLDLFQHCAEEMNHLAKFLPRLYADARGTA
jgi:hypothetical protein